MNRLALLYNWRFLIVITLIGLFFYAFRLGSTQVFTNDTARDTLKALQIWQNKELTLIGPPASFSLNTIREVYFGSLYLYIGILGLIAANWHPLGAVLPNTILFTLSIPLFYLFAIQSKDKFKSTIATVLYTLSPITVAHARFFWNPNLIIPFATLFWLLITRISKNNKINTFYSVSAGLVAGIMFNFHYITILPIIGYLLILFIGKQRLKVLLVLSGSLVTSLPILIFELKNNFYLSQSVWFNLSNIQSGLQPQKLAILHKLDQLINIFRAILGFKPAEIDYPTLFTPNLIMLVSTVLIICLIIILNRKQIYQFNSSYIFPLIISIVITIYFSFEKDLLIRYLFVTYPLLIWLITTIFYNPKYKFLSLLIFIPVIYSSTYILYDDPKLGKSYIALQEIEKICQKIVQDLPQARYNITENIRGDARAMAFRYCLNKDTKVKPQDELSYTGLSTLYVVSPSLEKIYQEHRWEFTASSPWELVKSQKIDSIYLFKFIK